MTASLPDLFLRRLGHIVPAAMLPPVLASFRQTKAVTFRINTLRGEVEEIRKGLLQAGFSLSPLPWPGYAFEVPPEQKRALTESIFFSQGWIYIQNPSSLLAVETLAPRPGEEILDLCAAPGGKTSHLAMLMGDQGRIAAVEPVRERYFRLRANLQRLGITIARCYRMDGRSVGRKTPERFDRVLIDAPCSSEARFRTEDPDSFAHWGLRKIRECARKQKRLLMAGADALKPGGRLLYCTCSFAPEENEAVVDHVLRRLEHLRVVPIELPAAGLQMQNGLDRWQEDRFDPQVRHAVRILPDRRFDGFFLCLMEKG